MRFMTIHHKVLLLLMRGPDQRLKGKVVLQEKMLVGEFFTVAMYKLQVEHTILQQLN
jgi:hypothetical protein